MEELTIREAGLQSHVGFLLNGPPLQEAGWVNAGKLGLNVGTLQGLVLT